MRENKRREGKCLFLFLVPRGQVAPAPKGSTGWPDPPLDPPGQGGVSRQWAESIVHVERGGEDESLGNCVRQFNTELSRGMGVSITYLMSRKSFGKVACTAGASSRGNTQLFQTVSET